MSSGVIQSGNEHILLSESLDFKLEAAFQALKLEAAFQALKLEAAFQAFELRLVKLFL